jgi:hypothetical protein
MTRAKPRTAAKKARRETGSAIKPTKLADNDRTTRRARQIEKRNAEYERQKDAIRRKLDRPYSVDETDRAELNHIESQLIRVEQEQIHAQDHLIEMVPPGFFDGKRDLSKTFTVIAKNIEDSLVKAGAEAGIDYTYLDLYQLASPFVLAMFVDKDADEISFDADNF